MKLATEFIKLNSGIEICAPADVNLMTNFVLREQGDWFEDEIHFVREFVQPGMNVLDIGANYGLYATAMAENIGSDGKMWCFEPTPNTASALRSTIERNGFSERTTIIEAGLSDHEGEASFYMSPNAELNSLTPEEGMEKVTIKLKTMDMCADEESWPKIDFIKLDAEGEEVNILKGGESFFKSNDPVVMFELKHKDSINLELIGAFDELGYKPYYLVPGLNVLAPFDKQQNFDGYLLNLFAVKTSSLEKLRKDGVVVDDESEGDDSLSLPETLGSSECYQGLGIDFSATQELNDEYGEALTAYLYSSNQSLSAQTRYFQLRKSLDVVKSVLGPGKKGEAKAERLVTYARIAYDMGNRTVGNQILRFIVENYIKHSRAFGISQPFVLPGTEFESVSSKGNVDAWFCSVVLDQLIRKQAYSTFFAGIEEAMKFIEVMTKLGFVLPDMSKRAELVRERFANKAANA